MAGGQIDGLKLPVDWITEGAETPVVMLERIEQIILGEPAPADLHTSLAVYVAAAERPAQQRERLRHAAAMLLASPAFQEI